MNGSRYRVLISGAAQARMGALGMDAWGSQQAVWDALRILVAQLRAFGVEERQVGVAFRGELKQGERLYSLGLEFCTLALLVLPGHRDVRVVHAFDVNEPFSPDACEAIYRPSPLAEVAWQANGNGGGA